MTFRLSVVTLRRRKGSGYMLKHNCITHPSILSLEFFMLSTCVKWKTQLRKTCVHNIKPTAQLLNIQLRMHKKSLDFSLCGLIINGYNTETFGPCCGYKLICEQATKCVNDLI
jgi:hypothetical protein